MAEMVGGLRGEWLAKPQEREGVQLQGLPALARLRCAAKQPLHLRHQGRRLQVVEGPLHLQVRDHQALAEEVWNREAALSQPWLSQPSSASEDSPTSTEFSGHEHLLPSPWGLKVVTCPKLTG